MTGVTATAGGLADALAALLAERRGPGAPVVVGHPDDPVLVAVQEATGRVVTAPGAGARLLVGCGVAAAGAIAVVLAEDGTLQPAEPAGQVTAVVRSARAAEAARRAGWTVAQPVWPADVEPLLAAALSAVEPVVLRLHAEHVAAPDEPARAPTLGTPRIIAEGRTGVVVAAGALVAAVQAARPALRAKGLDLAVVDAHTRGPRAARSPLAEPDGRVLVGGPQAAAALAAGELRPGALQVMAVPADANLEALLGERVLLHS